MGFLYMTIAWTRLLLAIKAISAQLESAGTDYRCITQSVSSRDTCEILVRWCTFLVGQINITKQCHNILQPRGNNRRVTSIRIELINHTYTTPRLRYETADIIAILYGVEFMGVTLICRWFESAMTSYINDVRTPCIWRHSLYDVIKLCHKIRQHRSPWQRFTVKTKYIIFLAFSQRMCFSFL